MYSCTLSNSFIFQLHEGSGTFTTSEFDDHVKKTMGGLSSRLQGEEDTFIRQSEILQVYIYLYPVLPYTPSLHVTYNSHILYSLKAKFKLCQLPFDKASDLIVSPVIISLHPYLSLFAISLVIYFSPNVRVYQ